MDSAGLDEDLRGTFLFNGGIDCHFYTKTSLYHTPLLWPLSALLPWGQFLTPQCKSQALATRRPQTGKWPWRPPSRSTRPETFLLGIRVKGSGLFHRKYGEMSGPLPATDLPTRIPKCFTVDPVHACKHMPRAKHGPYLHIELHLPTLVTGACHQSVN